MATDRAAGNFDCHATLRGDGIGNKRGDGSEKRVDTYAGKAQTEATLRRFLVGPKGAEITGWCESPDGKAVFVNIQHPGENTTGTGFAARTFESNWPGNGAGLTAAYGPGGATARPRSATVMITKIGGGKIGL